MSKVKNNSFASRGNADRPADWFPEILEMNELLTGYDPVSENMMRYSCLNYLLTDILFLSNPEQARSQSLRFRLGGNSYVELENLHEWPWPITGYAKSVMMAIRQWVEIEGTEASSDKLRLDLLNHPSWPDVTRALYAFNSITNAPDQSQYMVELLSGISTGDKEIESGTGHTNKKIASSPAYNNPGLVTAARSLLMSHNLPYNPSIVRFIISEVFEDRQAPLKLNAGILVTSFLIGSFDPTFTLQWERSEEYNIEVEAEIDPDEAQLRRKRVNERRLRQSGEAISLITLSSPWTKTAVEKKALKVKNAHLEWWLNRANGPKIQSDGRHYNGTGNDWPAEKQNKEDETSDIRSYLNYEIEKEEVLRRACKRVKGRGPELTETEKSIIKKRLYRRIRTVEDETGSVRRNIRKTQQQKAQ